MKKTLIHSFKTGLAVAFMLVCCNGCHKDPFKVDVSDTKSNISISRFEKELFTADPSSLEQLIPVWEKKYGAFFSHFCYVTKLGDSRDPMFAERLKAFVTDYQNYLLFSRTMQVYPDLDQLTAQINEAFRHYLYYFPEKPLPRLYTFVSGMNQSAITDDSLLAIGLDRYLGADEPIYRQAGIYNYLIRNMHKGKIVSDCMNFWGETEFAYNDSINNLVWNMIYQGRLLYFVSAMLPDQPDSLKWGYSSKNLDYLKKSEKSMWAFLIEHKLLFNTDRFTIDKYMLEGPFTHDFGRESPARAAVWIGYRIVESYMQRNSGVSFPDLMNEKDYMKILNLSGYNP